jgi:cbb3-type cytochrome oxidase subunit 3
MILGNDNSTSLEITNIFPNVFRYFILAILYYGAFISLTKPSVKFILYMIVFILNFFSIVFVFKDVFSIQLLVRSIYDQNIGNSEYQNWFTKYFILIIFITMALFICSLSIILAVFSYGKKTTNDYKSYKLSSDNELLLSQFDTSYQLYVNYLAMFIYFIIYAHTTGVTRKLMFNLACILFSIVISIASIYSCVAAVEFLKTKQYKRQLYE